MRTNTSIRFIDLEGNNLTENGTKTEGIKEICKALETNDIILYMNLTNTHLNAECGEYLERMLQKNQTLIMLDVDQNSLLKIP